MNERAIGFVQFGGAVVGSQIRDVQLANELSRRGHQVHTWWAMDRCYDDRIHVPSTQSWLFNSARYGGYTTRECADRLGRAFCWLTSDRWRARQLQKRAWFLRRQMQALVHTVCYGVEHDRRLIQRFAHDLERRQITHVFPNLAVFAPFVEAACRQASTSPSYTVTFQGYELYSNYAREIGLETQFYDCLRKAVRDSGGPAVAVSDAYRLRVCKDIGLLEEEITVIPPGIPNAAPLEASKARSLIEAALPGYSPDLPLVSYVGRQDSEKGIDLLLYAAKLLREQGIQFQLAVCGPTAFGANYAATIPSIAENLRLPVLWHGYMSEELKTAILQTSHCTVYPPIHLEPFGMVPVESMILGTPAIVSDTGGVAETVTDGNRRGGLVFKSWDSGDLARQIRTVLLDAALHRELTTSARQVASRFSVTRLGDLSLALIPATNQWKPQCETASR